MPKTRNGLSRRTLRIDLQSPLTVEDCPRISWSQGRSVRAKDKMATLPDTNTANQIFSMDTSSSGAILRETYAGRCARTDKILVRWRGAMEDEEYGLCICIITQSDWSLGRIRFSCEDLSCQPRISVGIHSAIQGFMIHGPWSFELETSQAAGTRLGRLEFLHSTYLTRIRELR